MTLLAVGEEAQEDGLDSRVIHTEPGVGHPVAHDEAEEQGAWLGIGIGIG